MGAPPRTVHLSRGRTLDLSRADHYPDMLTGIAQEILRELSELEKLDLKSLGKDVIDEVAGITQIRLLNELYYCLGQLRALGVEHDVKRAIQDLGDIWNRYIDSTNRPAALKFQVDPAESQVQ